MDAEVQAKYGAPRYCQAGIAESSEAYFFYPVILGIDRAVDWIASHPDVDKSRFCYQVTSQGGGFGLYLCGKIAGSDWQAIFRDARRWFEANYETLPRDGIATKVGTTANCRKPRSHNLGFLQFAVVPFCSVLFGCVWSVVEEWLLSEGTCCGRKRGGGSEGPSEGIRRIHRRLLLGEPSANTPYPTTRDASEIAKLLAMVA